MITALPLAPRTWARTTASASAPDAPGECGANAPAFAQALRDAGERLAKPADTAPSDDDSGANLATDAVALAGLVAPWVAPVAPAIVDIPKGARIHAPPGRRPPVVEPVTLVFGAQPQQVRVGEINTGLDAGPQGLALGIHGHAGGASGADG